MVDRIPLRAMARSAPASAVGGPSHRAGRAIPVMVWIIDSQGRDVEVAGEAVAWTSRTVEVRYVDDHGREGAVRVWASAVTRRAV